MYACVQVTFLNEKTGEYQFYEVTFRSIKPSALSVISLTTAVRMRKPHSITVDNPLPTPANLSCTSTVADIIIPTQISVQPESTVLHCTSIACWLTSVVVVVVVVVLIWVKAEPLYPHHK